MKTNGTTATNTATDWPESLIIIEKGSLCVLKREALGSIVT